MRNKIKKIIFFSLFCANVFGKIYDCFPFYNELEVLKIRFEELYEEVDYFVIVEGKKTFCNFDKPLYFQENKGLFQKYKDKIIHVIIESFPQPTDNPIQDRWVNEAYTRQEILKGLKNCSPDDIIIISDADEIPARSSISAIKQFFQDKPYLNSSFYNEAICQLNMRLFLFHLNVESKIPWNGAVKATYFKMFEKITPWDLRLLHNHYRNIYPIERGGWHLHSLVGSNDVRLKEKLLGPYHYDILARTDYGEPASTFRQRMLNGYGFDIIEMDDNFPVYVKENRKLFEESDLWKKS